jgi:hypothetical protein
MPVWYCKWFQFSAVAGAGSQPLVLTPFFDFGWINRSFFIVPTVRLPEGLRMYSETYSIYFNR